MAVMYLNPVYSHIYLELGLVDDMQLLFVGKRDFNEDISDWDTSRVTNLYETFSYAESFTGDISRWDVSKVWKMFGLFNGAYSDNLSLKHLTIVVFILTS